MIVGGSQCTAENTVRAYLRRLSSVQRRSNAERTHTAELYMRAPASQWRANGSGHVMTSRAQGRDRTLTRGGVRAFADGKVLDHGRLRAALSFRALSTPQPGAHVWTGGADTAGIYDRR